MTTKERLLQEYGCAITAVLGDLADEEYEDGCISRRDLIAIYLKVEFYLDLDISGGKKQ